MAAGHMTADAGGAREEGTMSEHPQHTLFAFFLTPWDRVSPTANYPAVPLRAGEAEAQTPLRSSGHIPQLRPPPEEGTMRHRPRVWSIVPDSHAKGLLCT